MPRDAIVGVGLLAFAIVFWLGADAIPRSPLSGTVGADGLPKLLAVSLGVLSCVLILQSVAVAQRSGGQAPPSPERTAGRRRQHARAFVMLAIGIGYLVILETVGYLVSVALLIGTVAVYNGKRPSFGLLAVVVTGAAFFYLLFVHVLKVPLPAGVWPELLRGV